jgi:hypothetical protein
MTGTRSKVLAAGPYFADPKHVDTQRRVTLTELACPQGARGNFVVLVQRTTTGEKSLINVVKRVRVRGFTRAVRVFCDCMLDLALAADREEQRQASRRAG